MTEQSTLPLQTVADPASATSALASAPDPATLPSPVSPWWRIADFGVLGLWIVIVGVTLSRHEKWCDEAQAWLIARDLSFSRLWFYELRYEGSPGLWHTVLWIAQHWFHAPYAALGPIGMACATAGAAWVIFKAPFPRYIRWPLAFTYFLVYQYAVIARQYTMLPFFTFLAAWMFKDRQRPLRMALVLALLSLVSFHGTLLAGAIGFAYLVETLPAWRGFDTNLRRNYWIAIGLMVCAFVFVFLVLKPPADSLEMAYKRGALLQMPGWSNRQGQTIGPALKLSNIISGAFLDYPIPSATFVILAGVWCATRRRLLAFALGVGLQLALYSFLYGTAHHHGTAFVAAIAGLWIAWPTDEERKTFSLVESRMLVGITSLLLCLCAVNIWDGAVTIERDYLYPYSGAEDAANYLKSVGADRRSIFGFAFGSSAVQPYFEHRIYANIPTSYIHNGQPGYGFWLDAKELQRVNPEYIVVFSPNPEATLRSDEAAWESYGYKLAHFSDGYYFYKREIYERETYFIYRRVYAAAF